MKKKYTIWSPPYNHFSGGIRALHELNQQLNKKGFISNLHYENKHDNENIVIYPEIVTKNLLNADCTFQWLLADAIKQGISFEWVEGLGGDHILTVNIIDLNIFKPRKKIKKKIGYWIGKGNRNIDLPDDAELINKFDPSNREDLAEQLASYEYIISFDSFTALNFEATMLGTPVFIANQTLTWSKEKLIKTQWPTFGLFWSLDELEEAKKAVKYQYEAYINFISTFDQLLDDFIDITQKNKKEK